MPRIAKNQLVIRPIPGTDFFFLTGQCDGKQIRLKSRDVAELEIKKAELELQVQHKARLLASAPIQQYSYLSVDQMRDAEAAFKALLSSRNTCTLLEAVTVGIAHLGTGSNVNAVVALNEWQDYQRDTEQLFDATLKTNKDIVTAFLEHAKIVTLGEITPNMIDSFVATGRVKSGTRLTRAARLNAWFNFCVDRKKYLRASPMGLDMPALAKRAERDRERARILKPEQCQALLDAAASMHGGLLLPYTILATWCFMRNAEVLRTTPEAISFNAVATVDVFPRKAGTASYRRVKIPKNVTGLLKACIDSEVWKKGKPVPFSRNYWDDVREAAGLVVRGKATREGMHRPITGGVWQENLLRHTGISYHHQMYGDITNTAREAGNSQDVAFKHYISLPIDGDAEKFYSARAELKKEVAQDSAQQVA